MHRHMYETQSKSPKSDYHQRRLSRDIVRMQPNEQVIGNDIVPVVVVLNIAKVTWRLYMPQLCYVFVPSLNKIGYCMSEIDTVFKWNGCQSAILNNILKLTCWLHSMYVWLTMLKLGLMHLWDTDTWFQTKWLPLSHIGSNCETDTMIMYPLGVWTKFEQNRSMHVGVMVYKQNGN